jgi:predicted membrane metal-binding protein
VIAALVCVASAGYLLMRRVIAPRALVLAAVFLAGILTIQVRSSGNSGQAWLGDGQPVFVTAQVIAEGNVQADGPAELRQRIDVETEKVESAQNSPAQSREVHAGVRLNIYSRIDEDDSPPASPASAMQLFHYGQRIRFPATLVIPRNYRNPGAFDYATYLGDKGLIATASTKYATIETLPGFSGSRVML